MFRSTPLRSHLVLC